MLRTRGYHQAMQEFRRRLDHQRNPRDVAEDMFEVMAGQQRVIEGDDLVIADQLAQIRLLKARTEEGQMQLQRMNHIRNPGFTYVSVLVDGNYTHFLNELMREGFDGGARAASLLAQEVQGFLEAQVPYAVQGAACTILMCATPEVLIPQFGATSLSAFIRGFNSNLLANFVEVAGGRENVDVRLHSVLRNDLDNDHCRHIVFCGSGNINHGTLLQRLQGYPNISLIEAMPFPERMRDIASTFKNTKLNNVFVSSDTLEWDDRRSNDQDSDDQTSDEAERQLGRVEDLIGVHLNREGQRVDGIIAHSLESTIIMMNRKDLCTDFVIQGTCPDRKTRLCRFNHPDVEWTWQDRIDMLHIRRWECCSSGLQCRRPDCVYGHCCPFGDECMKEGCGFPPEMHDVDSNIVATL